MYKNLIVAVLAATALSASAAYATEPQFVFRWKAPTNLAASGSGGDTGTSGDGSETGNPGGGETGGGDGSEGPGDGSGDGGSGDGGGDGDGSAAPKKYNLVWVSQDRSPGDEPDAWGIPPFSDGARQYAPDFLSLPSGVVTMGDTIQICWESRELWNRLSARSVIQIFDAGNIELSSLGSLDSSEGTPTFTEPSDYGCFDLKTGGNVQDYGYLSFGITVTSDWYGYPAPGTSWEGGPWLYEFSATTTAGAVFFPVE